MDFDFAMSLVMTCALSALWGAMKTSGEFWRKHLYPMRLRKELPIITANNWRSYLAFLCGRSLQRERAIFRYLLNTREIRLYCTGTPPEFITADRMMGPMLAIPEMGANIMSLVLDRSLVDFYNSDEDRDLYRNCDVSRHVKIQRFLRFLQRRMPHQTNELIVMTELIEATSSVPFPYDAGLYDYHRYLDPLWKCLIMSMYTEHGLGTGQNYISVRLLPGNPRYGYEYVLDYTAFSHHFFYGLPKVLKVLEALVPDFD